MDNLGELYKGSEPEQNVQVTESNTHPKSNRGADLIYYLMCLAVTGGFGLALFVISIGLKNKGV